jgi:hypothetical protein
MAAKRLKKDDSDEISIATANAENRNIIYSNEPTEYVAKFQFQPKTSGKNADVAQTHYQLLQAIKEIYPEVKIFDNYNEEINQFPPLKSYAEYLRHFNLQFVKHNEKKNRQPQYLSFHRIITSVSLSEIRRHTIIASLLRKVNTRLTNHLWKEDETRIANLGFHVGVDPSNHLKEDFEHLIRKKIVAETKTNIKKIPRFQCAFTSPYLVDSDGNRTSSKSYDIQCKQEDAAVLIKLLQQTYQQNPTFVFHKMRHQNLQAYKNAIRKQNSYLSKSRVVPIQGIHEEQMFYLENELLASDGILSVLRHRLSEKTGRWSVMTTEQDFKGVSELLAKHLAAWTAIIIKNYGLLTDCAHLPPIGLAFKNQPYDDGSDASFQTYLSACSSIYSLEDETYDFPPIIDRPIPQAWGPPDAIPVLVNPTPSTQSVSGISQDDFDKVTRENQKLTRQIQELMNKMQAWEQKQVVPPTVVPQQLDMQSIIAATTEAVLSTMARLQQVQNPGQVVQQQIIQTGGANNSTEADDSNMVDPIFPANEANPNDESMDSCLTPERIKHP